MELSFLSSKNTEPAECIIRIGDEQISDLYPSLVEVTIDVGRSEAAEATMVFETRRDTDGLWTIQDDERIAVWESFRISAAFGDSEEEILRGYIRQVKVDYPEDSGSAKVTVIAQDESILLDREHSPTTWGDESPVSDGMIMTEILGRYQQLSPDSNNGDGLTGLRIQQAERDSQFVRARAEANGYELIFSEGSVYFGPMRLDMDPQDTIMVYAGPATNCLSFSVDEDGQLPDSVIYEISDRNGASNIMNQVGPDVAVMGTTPANSESMGLPAFSWRVTGRGGQTEEEVRTLAQAKANLNSFKIKATGQLDGSLYGHVLRIAEPVGVDGVGDKYGGIYYVDRVTHRFNFEGYTQGFTLIRNAYGDNLESGSGMPGGLF